MVRSQFLGLRRPLSSSGGCFGGGGGRQRAAVGLQRRLPRTRLYYLLLVGTFLQLYWDTCTLAGSLVVSACMPRLASFVFKEHAVTSQKKKKKYFGLGAVNDWTIRDGPNLQAKIVARAQGLHIGAGRDEESWFNCFSIVFTDERFKKGSSLQVLGILRLKDNDELAITGGTGDFAFAQGVATCIVLQDTGESSIRQLKIRAMCLTIPEQVHVTKIGPWGGNGGKEFEIPESVPQHLESVTIRSGVVIDSIAFSYVNQAGKKKNLGPWGGNGELTDTITFAPIEIVKEVSGTTGTFDGDTVVTSLTFVTNVRTYGPFGKPNGTAFSVPLTDTNIVGFFVRAGRLVNAIGVYAHPSVQNH